MITSESAYLVAIHVRGFKLSGTVYGIDAKTGRQSWKFDADGEMLPTASSPILFGRKLFLGEGMHANSTCRLYCLDSASGKEVWKFQTTDHIEGGALVAGENLIFPAGNDGLYSVRVGTGEKIWNFCMDAHIDSTPTISGGRLYVGSGLSRKFRSSQMICLDPENGKPIWHQASQLPVWAEPVVANGRAFFGMGNGRITEAAEPPEVPAGAVACLDCDTGAIQWIFKVSDAVFGRPIIVSDRVVFGSRNGQIYGLSVLGEELFRIDMGSSVIAAPILSNDLIYAISVSGRLSCIDPGKGLVMWSYELAHPGSKPKVYATPRIVGNRIFIAFEMQLGDSSYGVVTLMAMRLEE